MSALGFSDSINVRKTPGCPRSAGLPTNKSQAVERLLVVVFAATPAVDGSDAVRPEAHRLFSSIAVALVHPYALAVPLALGPGTPGDFVGPMDSGERISSAMARYFARSCRGAAATSASPCVEAQNDGHRNASPTSPLIAAASEGLTESASAHRLDRLNPKKKS
jgi:hypothetical protein